MSRKRLATATTASSRPSAEHAPPGTRRDQPYGPAEAALRLFAAQANKGSLHPLVLLFIITVTYFASLTTLTRDGMLNIIRRRTCEKQYLDWERFYRFIVSAHVFRKGWNHTDVKRLLEGLGFPGGKAKDLAEAYWHGRCSLHLSKNLARGARYAGWVRRGRPLLN